MVRAAASGAFDFSTYDRYSRQHNLRLAWILEEVNRQSAFLVEGLNAIILSAAAGHPNIDVKKQFESAVDILFRASSKLFPWLPASREEVERQQAEELYALWVKEFGDPETEEVKKQIEETVEALRSLGGAK